MGIRSLYSAALIVCSVLAIAGSGVAMGRQYQHWLDEDVRWIITPQERAHFLKLSTDAQRDQFVVEFWERRNPYPGAKENSFKTEHYKRLEFANEHFAAGVRGDESDRGHIYIVNGPPDRIDNNPSAKPPFQVWEYRSLHGNSDVAFKFVDRCSCGEYKLQSQRLPKF